MMSGWMVSRKGSQAGSPGRRVGNCFLPWGPKILRPWDPVMMGRGLLQCGFGGEGGPTRPVGQESVPVSSCPARCLLSSLRQQGGRVRWDDAGLDIVGREGIAEDRYHTRIQLCRRLETLAAKGAASQVRGDQARHGPRRDCRCVEQQKQANRNSQSAHGRVDSPVRKGSSLATMSQGLLDMATSVRIPGAAPDQTARPLDRNHPLGRTIVDCRGLRRTR